MWGGRALFWPHSPVSLGLSRNTWGEVATYVNTCVTHKHLPSLTSTSSVHPHWLCFWGPINILLYKDLLRSNQTRQTKNIICTIEHPHMRKKRIMSICVFGICGYPHKPFTVCVFFSLSTETHMHLWGKKICIASSGAQSLDDFVGLKKLFGITLNYSMEVAILSSQAMQRFWLYCPCKYKMLNQPR